jgi:hypothetical protein
MPRRHWGSRGMAPHFLTSALHDPAALPPGKKPYPLDRKLSEPQSQSGRRGQENYRAKMKGAREGNRYANCTFLRSLKISGLEVPNIGGEVLSLSAVFPLRPGRFLVLISVRGWVDPEVIVRLEGLGQLKNPVTFIPRRIWIDDIPYQTRVRLQLADFH